jgi:hypothetical protein
VCVSKSTGEADSLITLFLGKNEGKVRGFLLVVKDMTLK